jgi:hypothetical protein
MLFWLLERNILHSIEREKAKWIGHISCRIWLLKHVIEEKMARRRRRCKQLLDDLKEKGRYREMKKEAPDHTLCRTSFGRGF